MTLKELIERYPNGVLELSLIPFYADGATFTVELDTSTLRPHKAWRICADGMGREAKEDCWSAAEYNIPFIMSSCEGADDWEEVDDRYLWEHGDIYPNGDPTQQPIDAALWFTPNP